MFAVAFGAIAIWNPRLAANVFVIVFAVYAFIDAALSFATAVRMGKAGEHWGWLAFEGVVGVAAGVLALVMPGMTLIALVLLVALRAFAFGVLEIVAAFSWAGAEHRWMLGLTGALSVVLGGLLLASPSAGAVALIWTIGIYAIVFGIALFAAGLHMLSLERKTTVPPTTTAAAH
jgi:uncharacterized membrane protein HdeD (DUF308 family)